jgi:hypothetical protein
MIRPKDDTPSPYQDSFRDYVQLLSSFADGHVFDVCAFLNRYETDLLNKAKYLEVDVYFKGLRSPNTTLSFSTWDHEANMQIVVVRVQTSRSSSEVQFARMFLAIFNLFLDAGIKVKFSGPEFWRVVADFCMGQARGVANAACRVEGGTSTVEEMLKTIMDGCKTHRDRMIRKVIVRCVSVLQGATRAKEYARLQEKLVSACDTPVRGAWVQAWDEIATQYPHVQKQGQWWCNELVMSMIVFAERPVVMSSIPDSTNKEEGRCVRGDFSAFIGIHACIDR